MTDRELLELAAKAAGLVALAESLGAKDRFGHPALTDLIFDRRLQALRKAGKIRYSRTKWEIRP